jgi:hypothetical protein
MVRSMEMLLVEVDRMSSPPKPGGYARGGRDAMKK